MPTTDYIWEVTTPDTNLHKLKDAESMHYRGTLGTGGDITVLPAASASNKGDTYKVITDGAYAGQEAKAGDLFISDGSSWILISGSGGSGEDTWRNIKVNGAEKLGTADTTGAVDFVNGTNTTVSFDTTGNKIKIDAVDTTYEEATTSASGLMSASDKTKLNGIANGAEVNQNAFSNVKVGNTTIQADSKTDTLELVAGSNITITPDATNDKITIAATDTKYTAATAAPGNIASSGAVGTSTNYARQDHTHGISVATGDSNGQVKIAGQNASVKGLAAAAYKGVATTVTSGGTDLVTSGAVWSAIDNLPEPMIMKGTLGTGGTITSLPTASASNEGFVYKVITAGTYAGQAAKVGDFFVSCKPEGASAYSWVWFPSGDETFTDTWRSIKVNGTEKLGNAISSGAVDFVNGTNTTVEFVDDGKKIKINSSDTNTHRPIQVNGTQNLGNNTTPLNLKNGTNITVTADGGNVTIATSAEVNQNAFSNVKVGSTTVAADSKTDTLELVAGSNVTITPDATNDKITIAATDTNTHRPIQVNGTEILGNNTTALNLKAGSNVSVTNSNGTVTIAATDTKYTAGTGLQLVSGQFLTHVPRLSPGDANYKPGTNRFHMQEYSNASTNIPEAKWQHILTTQGSDGNYSTQLALGMTNVPSAYYRRMDSNNYSEWYRLTNALLQRYETGTITNGTWYRLFTINYTSYSYLHLRVLVKAGYANLYEAFICVRYTPNGMDGEYTSIRVIGSQPATKNLVLYKTSDTAIALAVCCDGAASTMGFEIHDMHNESNTIKAENISVENPFVALSAKPTTFGKHYYLTGDYSDLANKPALNYLPLSGGTMTGIITAKASVYEDSYSGALNMNNSNIYGLNSIYTADTADTAAEGIHFYRDATHVDTLWICNGDLLFVPNRALGTSTSKADSQKVGRFTANPTSGQVVITDGTTGGMKSSGYTIAKSVPSNADFSNTTYTFAGGTNSFTVTPSGGSAQTVSIRSNRLSNEDTRNTNQAPSWYMTNYAKSIANEFKATASIGADSSSLLNTTWCNLLTLVPWNDHTGSRPVQIAIANDGTGKRVQRVATADDTWSSWILLPNQDTNTWRGIQNNLTSDSTTDSLSAAQGKALANGSARDNTKLPLAGGTMTGSLTFANGIKNVVGDDCAMGDFNVGGTLALQGQNAATSVAFIKQGETWSSSANYGKVTYDGTNFILTKNIIVQKSNPAITLDNTNALSAGADSPALSLKLKTADGSAAYTTNVISFIGTNTGDGNNIPVRIGSSNGTTIISAGEAGVQFAAKNSKFNDENLYLVSDSSILLYKDTANDGTISTGPLEAAGFTGTITSGRVVVSNGTRGGLSASAYTIATSVPSGAVFTDTKNTAGSTDTSSKIFLIGATSQAANPQTYSDNEVYVTSGTLQTKVTQASATICANTANSSTAGGLSLYATDPTVYGVIFRGTGNQGTHGYVTSDWATYFTMSNSDNRGWVFRRNSSGNVASIDTKGRMVLNGSVTVGSTSAGGCMQYNSTNHCIDFVVT